MRYLALCGLFALPLLAQAADEPPLTISTKRLTLETATTIAQKTIEACRKVGYQVGVTVVDRSGQTQVVLRDTLAPELTVTVSGKKAYTAISFNSATSNLTDRFTSPFSVPKIDDLLISGGGVPIQAQGTLLGGVGVSGAPSGKIDEDCAQAGIDSVLDDLEME
ncbi:heme-binding protein [Candidatus Albibeggiatoa sp. nov. NOAA]|uniref:GlcG/HbpS family heme-binding protein n=1 Tax=Candidatus Albibeggiatoa sp. nov. NOAA TaxID=3162724 RepID=UPI0032FD8E91|nr:heme-binding protein [Thiotrichaceae bacterium]